MGSAKLRGLSLLVICLSMSGRIALGGSFFSDFSGDIVPAGASIFGDAQVTGGALQLTPNTTYMSGAFILGDLDPGDSMVGFTATFNVKIYNPESSHYADGFSFNLASGLGYSGYGSLAEEGSPLGLSVKFDTFDNSIGEAPAIDVSAFGIQAGWAPLDPYTGDRFVSVSIHLDANGLDVVYDGAPVFTDLLPGFSPAPGSVFGLGSRTGGYSSFHLVDDLSIETFVDGQPVPEPGTLALVGLGLAGVGLARRRRRASARKDA